jgi:4-amino-4-deoxy-L-arabinose transferase-like glycosyltransferase
MSRLASWALLGIAVRVAVSWASADAGVFADMAQYHERAQRLAATGTLWPDALRGPGYPAVLALAYRLAGDSLWTARMVNAAIGGALVLLTGVLARAAGAGARAWIAAAIVACYPALVLSSVYVMPEGVYSLWLVAAVMLVRHRSALFAVAAGAVAGVAMLTRSVGLALVAAPVAMWSRAASAREASWTTALSRVAMFGGAAAVVLLPWLAFTSRIAGGALLDSTSGYNQLGGNNPRATGRLELGDEAWLRDTYVAGASSVADGNTRAIAAGVSWAVAHPREWLRLAAVKLGYLFGLEGREHAWVYGHAYFGARSATTVTLWGWLLLLSFPVLCVAAALGAVRAPRPAPAALVAIGAVVVATAALHVLSFGESRFHLPLVPLLAVVASLGAPQRPAPPRSPLRVAVAAVTLAALSVAWGSQWQDLHTAMERLKAPDGWSSRPPY